MKSLEIAKRTGLSKTLRKRLDSELAVRVAAFEEHVHVFRSDWTRHGERKAALFSAVQLRLLGEMVRWITTLTPGAIYAFYFHLHDNVVAELAMLTKFDVEDLEDHLDLFDRHPADQGGSNFLGLIPQEGNWLLYIAVEPEAEVRVDWFGTAEQCRGLRTVLKLQAKSRSAENRERHR